MATRTDITLGIAGILATFVATFLGVYLGAGAQMAQKKNEDRVAFDSLLSVMNRDCEVALELSRNGRSAVEEGFVPAPGILLSAFYQNSLLMEQMSPDNVARLAPALGRASLHSTRYMRKVQRYDALQVPPADFPMLPGARDAVIRDKEAIASQLADIVKDYNESLSVVCEALSNEQSTGG